MRHYIPTLARRSGCFSRKLENLQGVLTVLFALITDLVYRKAAILALLFLLLSLNSFISVFGYSSMYNGLDKPSKVMTFITLTVFFF